MQFLGLEGAAGEFVEARAEGVQVGGWQAHSRGHGVAAVAEQQVVAFPQRGGQVETGNAAARAAELLAIAAEDDGRPVELLEHARRDNAHDADVPRQLTLDDDEVGLRVEPGAHRADDFLGDAAFDLLALAVVGVQLLREGQRFGQVAAPAAGARRPRRFPAGRRR